MNVINANLSDNEAGLLILNDEDRAKLQFPQDIEVFQIPPDLMRWIRDQHARRKIEETETDPDGSKEGASG